MPNTSQWNDPNTQVANTGPNTEGVYLIDPVTRLAISPAQASGGDAVTIADGADVAEGSTTDAAVTGDSSGTVNAHLRGLTKSLNPTALGDNLANPTAPFVGAFIMAWNGTTWDRVEDYFPSADAIPTRNGMSTVDQLTGWNGATWDRIQTDATGKIKSSIYGKNAAAGDTPLLLDASGRPMVNIAQVNGATPNLSQETGGNLAASKDDLDTIAAAQVAQGSTTSGQNGPLVQGAVTTASPTYTNGQTSPISLTPSGGLRAAQSGNWTVLPGNTPNTTPWLFNMANNNASVPTGAGNTVVKNAAGGIGNVVVTSTGTGAGNVQLFDNATTNSGLVLFAFPATVTVGTTYQFFGWAKNGITAQNVLNGPVFTVYYS